MVKIERARLCPFRFQAQKSGRYYLYNPHHSVIIRSDIKNTSPIVFGGCDIGKQYGIELEGDSALSSEQFHIYLWMDGGAIVYFVFVDTKNETDLNNIFIEKDKLEGDKRRRWGKRREPEQLKQMLENKEW